MNKINTILLASGALVDTHILLIHRVLDSRWRATNNVFYIQPTHLQNAPITINQRQHQLHRQ